MKELVKWILLLVVMVILYFTAIYFPDFVKLISIFLFFMGCYLMFNPNLIGKTKPKELSKLQREFRVLFDSFAGSKLSIERRRIELLGEFRFRYFGIVLVWCVFILVICLLIHLLPNSDNRVVAFITIITFLVVLILNESNKTLFGKKVDYPFSRRERVKADYFYHILKSVELTNRMLESDSGQLIEFPRSENQTFSNRKDFNITMNQYHVVNNNDNRVLNNNFNTIIEKRKDETASEKQLNLKSKFWSFYNQPSESGTNEEKCKHFLELLESMNKKHTLLKNCVLFKFESEEENGHKTNKIAFVNPLNSGSEPIIFAGFVKFLLKEEIINSLIKDLSFRKYLLDIFETRGSEMFKNFQPKIWKEGAVDSYVNYFHKYK